MRRRLFLCAVAAAATGGPFGGLLLAHAGTTPAPTRQGLSLIMVDRRGCSFCAAWKREILPGYGTHPTGRNLPLTIVPLDGPWPDGLALARAPAITPTFVLLRDRIEIARIEGYPGARYFWPQIEALLGANAIPSAEAAR